MTAVEGPILSVGEAGVEGGSTRVLLTEQGAGPVLEGDYSSLP